ADKRQDILENRKIVASQFNQPASQLVTMFQVHGTGVAVVDQPWAPDQAPEVDGIVTSKPGIVLGALAADCAPILFADTQAQIIGACHAGWRGAVDGIAQATIDTMVDQGANRDHITAVIGPCIGPHSYEVGPDFPAPFMAQDDANAAFFAPGDGDRLLFDLPGYLTRRLHQAGLSDVTWVGDDTLSNPDRFFSYRRSCHQQEPDYGRQVSVIMLTP
ncbi:MAG: peptidoglycan editing factor PgeF, partial [Pseudomonadota bacterium]